MMESVRTWVLSILAAALLLGLLESCAPKGPVRSVAKLAAGLALFLAVAAPLEELSLIHISAAAQRWSCA